MAHQNILLGRDRLLATSLHYLKNRNNGMYLIGPKGVGKSVLLEWLHRHYAKGCLSSCRENKGSILRLIVKTHELQGAFKNLAHTPIPSIEETILKTPAGWLFLDNAEELKPSLRSFLEPLRDRGWILILATTLIKSGYERIFWGLKRIEVPPLRSDVAVRVAKAFIHSEGLKTDPIKVARLSRGYPARLVHLARGEAVPIHSQERREEDEINIAPALLLFGVLAIVLRTIGVGVEEKELYIIGGVLTGVFFIVRWGLMETRKK